MPLNLMPFSTTPLVSVVTAVRNSEDFISETVESVLAQTLENFEYVIVDDGSTDKTGSSISLFSDSRLKIIFLPEPLGPCEARNIGISATQGSFIAILDGDDIANPKRLAEQVRFLEQNPACGAVGSWARVFGSQKAVRRPPVGNEALRASLLWGNPLVHSSMMIRREALPAKSNPYLKSQLYAEDYGLWLRIAKEWELANIPSQLVQYRAHGNQISVLHAVSARQSFLAARNEFLSGMGIPPHNSTQLSSTEVFYLGRALSSHGWLRGAVFYRYWLKSRGAVLKNSLLAKAKKSTFARWLINPGQKIKSPRNSIPK